MRKNLQVGRLIELKVGGLQRLYNLPDSPVSGMSLQSLMRTSKQANGLNKTPGGRPMPPPPGDTKDTAKAPQRHHKDTEDPPPNNPKDPKNARLGRCKTPLRRRDKERPYRCNGASILFGNLWDSFGSFGSLFWVSAGAVAALQRCVLAFCLCSEPGTNRKRAMVDGDPPK